METPHAFIYIFNISCPVLQGHGGLEPIKGCQWARGRVHSRQVANLPQDHTETNNIAHPIQNTALELNLDLQYEHTTTTVSESEYSTPTC